MPNYKNKLMKQTKKYLVAFLDILGFKEHIEQFDSGKKPNLLEDISNVVEIVTEYLPQRNGYDDKELIGWKKGLVIKSFSDCFSIAVPFDNELVDYSENVKLFYQYLAMFQVIMLKKGFLIRGGLTVGSYYNDNNIIFSGALVEAYSLESKKACFPRIIVSDKFIDIIRKINSTYRERMLLNELDDTFINPFNYSYIDAEQANIKKEKLEKLLPGSGYIDGDFNEISLTQKEIEITEILDLFISKESEYIDDKSKKEKYNWLLSLCRYELNLNNDRFEKYK